MFDTIRDLLTSKKFLVGISSSLTAIIIQFGAKMRWEWLDVETANHVSGIIVLLTMTYLGAQGAADHGKAVEAIRTKAETDRLRSDKPSPGA